MFFGSGNVPLDTEQHLHQWLYFYPRSVTFFSQKGADLILCHQLCFLTILQAIPASKHPIFLLLLTKPACPCPAFSCSQDCWGSQTSNKGHIWSQACKLLGTNYSSLLRSPKLNRWQLHSQRWHALKKPSVGLHGWLAVAKSNSSPFISIRFSHN